MDHLQNEKKWRAIWRDTPALRFNPADKDNKLYVLEMFSYPSAARLHMGHWYNFGLADSYARFKKMQGRNVFQPMGFDAFGLPAENYAIKTGIHPLDSTLDNIKRMEVQLSEMDALFDWDYKVITCLPDYFKWTQWIFLQLFKAGLAYQKEGAVNFCTGCQTAIANEQVVDGECERCHSPVERRRMKQWYFKITAYAEQLLADIDGLNWPEKTKTMQRNWIGKSTGGEIVFKLEKPVADCDRFSVFTTRADTLFGVSYVVLAPEHPLVGQITAKTRKKQVADYRAEVARMSEIDRQSTAEGKEKTGVFTGAYAIHPLTGRRVPVWIADYVLFSYGTGAVMGVPAHDERDWAFAKKYGLPITTVIRPAAGEAAGCYTEDGVLTASAPYNGLTSAAARTAILAALSKTESGGPRTQYRLRDWSISRQRYWGCPIPVVHCDRCGAVAVPEDQLPVTLPYDVNFTPDGKSPLRNHEGFLHTTCPECGRPATRDVDTMDGFVCSSWYFLRYADNKNAAAAFDKDVIDKMLPVDVYVGGAEHACMHLLYARFFTKVLRDLGYLSFSEPFTRLVHQGMILGADGQKMSKSRGNVANPDEYTSQFGSDALRLYLAFGFSYMEGGPWNDDGIRSIVKFLDRVERVAERLLARDPYTATTRYGAEERELDFVRNTAIAAVARDIEAFSFNTAVARIMELLNAVTKYEGAGTVNL
ncbi:MAG: leucine--tRNA ligase, partial [Clostridiales bacterium]|nr:leucine--tRNA ligase [Clostridiales bacterium]